MVATIKRSEPEPRLQRFDKVERALHWVNATLFLTLLSTAAVLYVGPLSAAIGRRELIRQVHVIAGLALPGPILAALALRSGGLRRDLRALNRWDSDDRRWLRSFGRDPMVRLGKFNPGQKLNAAFTAGAIPVMLATGSMMKWFSPFPNDWRTGATFVHDWVAIGLFVSVTIHIAKAVSDQIALKSMIGGDVPASWAKRHRPKWYDELLG